MAADATVRARPLVLVVDDDEAHCKLLSHILCDDYEVVTAHTGAEALALADQTLPDLVLSDFAMPDMTGVRCLERFSVAHPNCMRFLVTATCEPHVLRDAINVGHVYRFVQKPVDPEALRLDVQRALEHRRTTLELERNARLAAVGTLASSVVHDLRNSLQVVALVPSMLALRDEVALEDSMGMLQRAERVMTDLVDELLVLSKGQVPTYELQPASLTEAVRETVDMIRNTAPISDRNLELELAANLPPVLLAQRRCSRMLTNLIRNAAQATEVGGRIHVRVQPDGSESVVLEVRDNGPGIPDHIKDRLFEPMFSTKGTEGVGLGLTICKAVMQAHGGTLTCESQEGGGTSFFARFPVAK